MFEAAKIPQHVSKAEFQKESKALRTQLVNAQFKLHAERANPVIILVAGTDAATQTDLVNRLNDWMDPRGIETYAMGAPSPEERERPPMWRFWQALPPKGKMAIFYGAWYNAPLYRHLLGRGDNAALDQTIGEVKRFEKMLAAEGVGLIKVWLHLEKNDLKKKLKELGSNADTRWQISDIDTYIKKHYDRFYQTAQHITRLTSMAAAHWHIINAQDIEYARIATGKIVLQMLQRQLRLNRSTKAPRQESFAVTTPRKKTILDSLDMTRNLSRSDYEREYIDLQAKLNGLSRRAEFSDRSVVTVFEGFDAAGKGGAIRYTTQALDARNFKVIPISAPTEEELAHPYLWRFWRHLPGKGKFTIFDRSWYGRVLVERVENLIPASVWLRAYDEINDFEAEMVRHGVIVVKFWLSISPEEQLKRFNKRLNTPYKRYKLTEDDWRNREKWHSYAQAVNDMIDRTSTEYAPWTLIEAEDKKYARIKVMSTLCETIKAAL